MHFKYYDKENPNYWIERIRNNEPCIDYEFSIFIKNLMETAELGNCYNCEIKLNIIDYISNLYSIFSQFYNSDNKNMEYCIKTIDDINSLFNTMQSDLIHILNN